MIEHHSIKLDAKPRGFHLITQEVLDQLPSLPEAGILQLFIQHTSAGLCINENADPSVRSDMELWFDKNVRENESYYTHIYEGADDMPAHIKSVLIGNSIQLPIENGRLMLGTWQGIYLGEFRNASGSRKIVASILT